MKKNLSFTSTTGPIQQLRVESDHTRVTQLMDIVDPNDTTKRILDVNLESAILWDAQLTKLFEGPVLLRIKCDVSPGGLLVLGRIVQPNAGIFSTVFKGQAAVSSQYADVEVEEILDLNVQPV